MTKLPPNWITWKDFLHLVFQRWDKLCQKFYFTRRVLEWVIDAICTAIAMPLMIVAVIIETYRITNVTIRKIFGLPMPVKPKRKFKA